MDLANMREQGVRNLIAYCARLLFPVRSNALSARPYAGFRLRLRVRLD
jgi:hypothetical protein